MADIFFYFLIFISHSQANMSIKIRIEKELHETRFLELLGGLVLRVSVQLSVLILEVRFGTGLVRRQVRCCGGVLSRLLERGVATPPSPVS